MVKIDRKDLYYILYITIGALTLYFIYKEYESNLNNTASTATISTTTATTNTTPDYSNMGYSASLAPINFNVPNTSSGISASLHSFLSDNVGDSTNTNLASEYLNNSSFSSSNPLFTMTVPSNIAQATDINTNTNMILPSLSNPQAINTSITNPNIADLNQSLITQSQMNTDFATANYMVNQAVSGGVQKQEAAHPNFANVYQSSTPYGNEQIATY